jgi:ABC-type transporter Mla subunit MlaD
MCQALGPAFSQLGAPPRANPGDLAATRQAYIDYLSRASNAAQQAMDRLASVGPPPVQNGQQILDQLRAQLTQLRNNLNDAMTQLKAANPNEAAAIGPAFGAASSAVSMVGTLTSNPQLRAAIDQTSECQNVPGLNATPSTTTPGQPPS